MTNKVFLSLGSNKGDRESCLRQAIRLIQERIGRPLLVSSIMETEPVGFSSPNKFLNMALTVLTRLTAEEVLEETERIERELGRESKSENLHYGDRTVDIDILLFGRSVIDTPRLTVPHPRMTAREFVLVPLAEIAPGTVHPKLHKTINTLLKELHGR